MGGEESGGSVHPRGGRWREPWAHPTCSHGAQWDLQNFFYFGSCTLRVERHLCRIVCSLCMCVHWHESAYPSAGRSKCVHGCDLPHPCSGRCAHVSAYNLFGHQCVPSCTLMEKSFACENAWNVCMRSCVASRDLWGPYMCGRRGACDLRMSVQMRVDPGVWKCLWVCSIIPAPPALAALPSPHPHSPLKAHSTSMPPQLHAPRCSAHQCVLDQEKTESSGGTLVPGPPSPRPLCCVTRMGLSLLPLPQYAIFPGALGSERGPRQGPPGRALAPHPARSTP